MTGSDTSDNFLIRYTRQSRVSHCWCGSVIDQSHIACHDRVSSVIAFSCIYTKHLQSSDLAASQNKQKSLLPAEIYDCSSSQLLKVHT